jgi:hypothetical protein
VLVVGVALFGPPAHARADTDGGVEDSLGGEARALYEIGRSLFEAGDFAAALPKFQRAYELSSEPRLLWNVAACEASLKHYARAMTFVDRYVAIGGERLGDSDRAKAARFKAAAKQFIATVTVTTSPDAVVIAVDGESIGSTPVVYLEAGKHRIVFTKPGHRGLIRVESVEAGADLAWNITLEKLRVRSISGQPGAGP